MYNAVQDQVEVLSDGDVAIIDKSLDSLLNSEDMVNANGQPLENEEEMETRIKNTITQEEDQRGKCYPSNHRYPNKHV